MEVEYYDELSDEDIDMDSEDTYFDDNDNNDDDNDEEEAEEEEEETTDSDLNDEYLTSASEGDIVIIDDGDSEQTSEQEQTDSSSEETASEDQEEQILPNIENPVQNVNEPGQANQVEDADQLNAVIQEINEYIQEIEQFPEDAVEGIEVNAENRGILENQVNEENQDNEDNQEPVKKKAKLESPRAPQIIEDDDDDDQKCPICLDNWSSTGDHRLCCLKCGHLFGLSCINQWLNSQSAGAKRCPECNTKANKKHVRILFAKKLLAIDTSELEDMKNQLKQSSIQKTQIELELTQYKLREQQLQSQITRYQKQASEFDARIKHLTEIQKVMGSTQQDILMQQKKIYEICPQGHCRVMAYNNFHKFTVISTGNSIKKLYFDSAAIPQRALHSNTIRDLEFQKSDHNILLTVGFDKKLVLTDMRNNLAIHSYNDSVNLWSCCWSNYNNYTFFAGGVGGKIAEYDIRQLRSSLNILESTKDKSPVTAIASIPSGTKSFHTPGILSCQLNSCFAYSLKDGKFVANNKIGIDGPFVSLRYNEKNDNIILTCRPNPKNNYLRQLVCSLEKSSDYVKFNTIHSFSSGSQSSVMSRPCQMQTSNDSLVVAYNESIHRIQLWSISTGNEYHSIPLVDNVVDMCYFQQNQPHLSVLSSKNLYLYNHTGKETKVKL